MGVLSSLRGKASSLSLLNMGLIAGFLSCVDGLHQVERVSF